MKVVLTLMLCFASFAAFAEGRCPPGQYPVGGQGVGGCAPIPGGASGGAVSSVPTGKWETRWGAIAEDSSANARGVPTATGASDSQKSKRDAERAAVAHCTKLGGQKCKVVGTYHNQCIAIADPKAPGQGGGRSVTYRAETLELAQSEALKRCADGAAECSIFYSACSMSEFREF